MFLIFVLVEITPGFRNYVCTSTKHGGHILVLPETINICILHAPTQQQNVTKFFFVSLIIFFLHHSSSSKTWSQTGIGIYKSNESIFLKSQLFIENEKPLICKSERRYIPSGLSPRPIPTCFLHVWSNPSKKTI